MHETNEYFIYYTREIIYENRDPITKYGFLWKIKLGTTWYQEAEDYYLQILLYQSVTVLNVSENIMTGKNQIYLGTSMQLS